MGCLNTEPSRETVRGRSMASSDLYERGPDAVDVGRDVKSWCCRRGNDDDDDDDGEGEEGGWCNSERAECWPCIIGL